MLNFDPYLRPPDMNFIKKNFLFLNLVKRNSCGLHFEHQPTWQTKGCKFITYLFFCLPKCPVKEGTFEANYFVSACFFLMKAVADRRGSDRKVKRMIFTCTFFVKNLAGWQFSIKSLALKQCLHLRQMFT